MDLDLSIDRRENAGIVLALLGHALTLVPFAVDSSGWPGVWLSIGGQAALCVACLGAVVYLRDRGMRRGLLIGWLVGLVTMPLFVAVIVVLAWLARGG